MCSPALAVDGVVEINQTCAEDTGCFASDGPGFPVTITSPGSYRLTGSLALAAGLTGIMVSADFVTIDLNGFEIAGPIVCSGTPATCPAIAQGDGITRTGVPTGTTVTGGTVRGMPGQGLLLGFGALVENMAIVGNSGSGVSASGSSIIRNSRIVGNGDIGVSASGSVITRSVVHGNGNGGIFCQRSVVSGNAVTSNGGGQGINSNIGCTVTGNTVAQNAGVGIFSTRSLITSNTIYDNINEGIVGFSGSGYGSNVLGENNSGGSQVGGTNAVEIGGNVCTDDVICP